MLSRAPVVPHSVKQGNRIELQLALGRSPEENALVAEKGGRWRGTAMELLTQIGPAARITLPKVLSERLSRLAPALRSHGICISHARTANRREITIARIEQ